MLHDFIKTENLVSVGLVIALIISLFTGPVEISMSIGGGLTGYIGGRKSAEVEKGQAK